MVDVKEFFIDKQFDDTTLKYIENFIQEFDELFGKYIPREEVMERIKNNLDHNIVFVKEFEKDILGRFLRKDKTIEILDNMDEEKIKCIFFHEMIHCITAKEQYTGFSREYTTEDDDIKIITCSGLTEGFTEWLTRRRDEKVGFEEIDAYPILTEQTQFLIDIVGEDKFLDMGLNKPEKLMETLEEAGLDFYEEEEFQDFLENFDIIRRHEKELIGPEARLLSAIFGTKGYVNEAVKFAQKSIIETLMSRYENIEIKEPSELNKIYLDIEKYARAMKADDDDHGMYDILWRKVADLKENGFSNEEILSSLPNPMQEIVKLELEVEEFLMLDTDEKLDKISKGEIPNVGGKYFEKYYISRMVYDIFGVNIPYSQMIYDSLNGGLATIILERGYNPKTLAFEIINKDSCDSFFNLYNSTGKKSTYLGTFRCFEGDDMEIEEFTVIKSSEQRIEILKKYPELKEDSIIFTSPDNQILVYEGDNQYVHIDEFEDVYKYEGEMLYTPSYAENLLIQMDKKIKEKNRLVSIVYNESLLTHYDKIINQYFREYSEICSQVTILPEEIDVVTENISIEMIEENLKKLLEGRTNNVKKAFEEGIGYDE